MHRERPKTEALYRDSCALMPGGVSSPVRAFSGMQMTPIIAARGQGDTVTDVDGHCYIDFCQSWGALILGHAPDNVLAKVTEQLRCGSSFGMATLCEKQLAERLISHLPSMEQLRFVSSGTEAAMTAIRLARGFTGKSQIVKFSGHYHGHSDSLLIQAGSGVNHLSEASSKGIPDALVKLTTSLPFNALETTRQFIRSHDDIACILLEPIAGNIGVVPASRAFLEMLREESAKKGILLIFDEVITGFRVGLNGAQGHYNILPDLTCLGKVIGGGFPAAALGGRKEIMQMLAPLGAVYQAGTLSGNPLAMCAGLETIKTIEHPSFFPTLAQTLDTFLEPIRKTIERKQLPIAVQSAGSMFTLFFGVRQVESQNDLAALDKEKFKHFFSYLFERGVYLSPSPYEAHFLSSAHTPHNLEIAQQLILDYLD